MINPYVKKRIKAFDDIIVAKNAKNEILADYEDPPEVWNLDADDLDDPHLQYYLQAEMLEADEYTDEAFGKYLTARVLLTDGQLDLLGTVKKRKSDAPGNPVGVSHSNPLINTRQYEVHYDYGPVKEYSANIISENIYERV